MQEIKVFRKGKDIYCTIDGKEEPFALFTLFLGVANKEKIFEKLDNEKPAFVIEDSSDEKLVEAVAQVDKFIDKIFAKK